MDQEKGLASELERLCRGCFLAIHGRLHLGAVNHRLLQHADRKRL